MNIALRDKQASEGGGKKIWIDLDNSPHVPFFVPIVEELEKRGYSVLVTARDCFQVCELANLHGLKYKTIGRHYGKSRILKLAGLLWRALQLAPTVFSEKVDLAVSHGSRSQLLLSTLLRIRSVVIFDYEFARGLQALRPTWIMFPDVIDRPDSGGREVMTYPGIKEDVYVPRFKPDASIRRDLGLDPKDLVVTLRPPANEAHYHNPESEILLEAVISRLADHPETKVILLPRNRRQEMSIRKSWPTLFASGKIMVPDHVVDGLNLIWSSDLVICGGGTMNREAAALGVPVYSIFRGSSVSDVQSKLNLSRRNRGDEPDKRQEITLQTIVENIIAAAEPAGRAASSSDLNHCLPEQR